MVITKIVKNLKFKIYNQDLSQQKFGATKLFSDEREFYKKSSQ